MNNKMKIVVIGGTGLIGSKVVNILRQRGHEVVAASPSSGVNTLTGEGLAEALKGAQVVVDVANSPSFEDKPSLEFFETSGRNLLAAEKTAVLAASVTRVPLWRDTPEWIRKGGTVPTLDTLVAQFAGLAAPVQRGPRSQSLEDAGYRSIDERRFNRSLIISPYAAHRFG